MIMAPSQKSTTNRSSSTFFGGQQSSFSYGMEGANGVSNAQGISSLGSLTSKRKDDFLAQAQSQARQTDGTLLSQLSNNPFFTAVSDHGLPLHGWH